MIKLMRLLYFAISWIYGVVLIPGGVVEKDAVVHEELTVLTCWHHDATNSYVEANTIFLKVN